MLNNTDTDHKTQNIKEVVTETIICKSFNETNNNLKIFTTLLSLTYANHINHMNLNTLFLLQNPLHFVLPSIIQKGADQNKKVWTNYNKITKTHNIFNPQYPIHDFPMHRKEKKTHKHKTKASSKVIVKSEVRDGLLGWEKENERERQTDTHDNESRQSKQPFLFFLSFLCPCILL